MRTNRVARVPLIVTEYQLVPPAMTCGKGHQFAGLREAAYADRSALLGRPARRAIHQHDPPQYGAIKGLGTWTPLPNPCGIDPTPVHRKTAAYRCHSKCIPQMHD